MNRTSSASWVKLMAGTAALTLALAACGSSDDGDGDATASDSPSAAESSSDSGATDTFTNDPCSGDQTSADTLRVGGILPLTGNLAFLGPPEVAGVGLAVSDINAAGGVAGTTACLDMQDSGDSTDMSVSTNSAGPLVAWSFLGIDGMVTRTSRDSAVALDVLSGHTLGDVAWASDPGRPFETMLGETPRGLRIAMTTHSPVAGVEVHRKARAAVEEAAALLRDLGHEVTEADPPWQFPELEEQFGALWAPMISTQTAFGAMIAGREPTGDDIEALSMAMYRAAKELDALTYAGVEMQLQTAARGITQWIAQYDAVLCPSLAEPQVPLGTIVTTDENDPLGGFTRAAQFTPFTPVANLTGSPAINVPLLHDDELGLPLGVQLIGQPEGEGALLALSAQLEEARPWAGRRAPVA